MSGIKQAQHIYNTKICEGDIWKPYHKKHCTIDIEPAQELLILGYKGLEGEDIDSYNNYWSIPLEEILERYLHIDHAGEDNCETLEMFIALLEKYLPLFKEYAECNTTPSDAW